VASNKAKGHWSLPQPSVRWHCGGVAFDYCFVDGFYEERVEAHNPKAFCRFYWYDVDR
jgi:hypothetical protein